MTEHYAEEIGEEEKSGLNQSSCKNETKEVVSVQIAITSGGGGGEGKVVKRWTNIVKTYDFGSNCQFWIVLEETRYCRLEIIWNVWGFADVNCFFEKKILGELLPFSTYGVSEIRAFGWLADKLDRDDVLFRENTSCIVFKKWSFRRGWD